ncbi:MAG: hypothetical protein LAQ69_36555 [Acidobacteriia bacterium]|nr:hypothetical protein [Terriglobia bacterium]
MKNAPRNIEGEITLSAVAITIVSGGATRPVKAATWNAAVGAQSADKGKQALAFLSSELCIYAGEDRPLDVLATSSSAE